MRHFADLHEKEFQVQNMDSTMERNYVQDIRPESNDWAKNIVQYLKALQQDQTIAEKIQ